MNLAPDHEAIVMKGVRGLPPELSDRYWAFVADAIRTMPRPDLASLQRAVNIAVNRCYSEARA